MTQKTEVLILVDPAIHEWRGKKWCHLTTTGDLDLLHEFAAKLGLKREWFQDPKVDRKVSHPHYDITESKRNKAIELGAVAQSVTDAGRRMWAYRLNELIQELSPDCGLSVDWVPEGSKFGRFRLWRAGTVLTSNSNLQEFRDVALSGEYLSARCASIQLSLGLRSFGERHI